jgi:hypothetical protein
MPSPVYVANAIPLIDGWNTCDSAAGALPPNPVDRERWKPVGRDRVLMPGYGNAVHGIRPIPIATTV